MIIICRNNIKPNLEYKYIKGFCNAYFIFNKFFQHYFNLNSKKKRTTWYALDYLTISMLVERTPKKDKAL